MTTYTQGQLANLEAMIASGVLESEYDGKRLKYRNMAELLQAKAVIERALATAVSRPTGYNPTYSKGV